MGFRSFTLAIGKQPIIQNMRNCSTTYRGQNVLYPWSSKILKRQAGVNCYQQRWFLHKAGIGVGIQIMKNLKRSPIQIAIAKAEQVVGSPTSFLDIRKLLNDDVGAIAFQFSKLLKYNHPLVKTAREIILDSNPHSQLRGLIILLLAKALSQSSHIVDDISLREISNKQKILAEVIEHIHTGFLIHRGLVDLENCPNDTISSALKLGNKMAVLCGDFLHASASVALSDLRNSSVHELIATAIADMAQGYFATPETGQLTSINGIHSIPTSITQWKDAIYLSHGSLLSQACKSAALLSGQDSVYGDVCADYGKHIMLAHQARCDIQRLNETCSSDDINASHSLSELVSLPVAIMAQKHGGINWVRTFLQKKSPKNDKLYLLKNELTNEILRDPIALTLSEETCEYHSNKAVQCVEKLQDSEAGRTLIILTNALSSKP